MVFDINGNILESHDTELGYLVERKTLVKCTWQIDKQEVGHYETVKEYPNGGKIVDWIIDEPEEGHWNVQTENEYEHDYVVPDNLKDNHCDFTDEWYYQEYIEYTEEELANIQEQKLLNEQRQQEIQRQQEFNEQLPKTISDLDEAICTLYELTLGE